MARVCFNWDRRDVFIEFISDCDIGVVFHAISSICAVIVFGVFMWEFFRLN